ncbi:MAG TPA: hypothetical protein PLZ56_11510 [Anaerolineae bacterium]|nr:hypothetical protein [Anaerolineae bacterium]
MADNLTTTTTVSTIPSGTVIRTDDLGAAGHVQIIKLMDGTDGGTGLIGGDATNGLDVDVTRLPALPAGTNNIGDVDVLSLPALPAGTNNIGDVDVLTVPADPFGANADAASATGSISAKLRFIANTGIPVTGTVTVGSHAVTNAGTFAVQAATAGDVAHDAADSGNPVSQGLNARTTNPTAVADGDRVRAVADDVGRQVVRVGQVRDLMTHAHTQIASSSSETTILAAGAAGVFHDLTQLVITNQTATAVNVTIKDDTAGTTRMIIALAASGGAVIPFHRPVNQAVAEKPWTATLSSAAVTVNFYVQAEKNV